MNAICDGNFMLMLGQAAHGKERAEYSEGEQAMLNSVCAHVLEASVERGLPDDDANRFIAACRVNDESIKTVELAASIVGRLSDDDVWPIFVAHGWERLH